MPHKLSTALNYFPLKLNFNTAKRPTTSSSTPKSKRQKPQPESSLEGISLQPDKSYFSQKCKVSFFLNQDYKEYRQILRKLAEEFSLLRADAMNLGLLIISNWIEKGCRKDQFPPVTTQKFWTHCYRKVAQDPDGLNSRIVSCNCTLSTLTHLICPEIH
ncbi:hypothetical protein RMATCC62417_18133 [Rhizopus microsporus]|nr:hypothetical protein RMATCC62417_18133 [Rhizopus microsporus]